MLCLSINCTNDGMGMPAISNVTFFCSSMAALYLTVYIQIAKAARRKSVGRPDKCFDLGFTLANLASLRQALNKMSTTIQEKKEQLQTDLGELKVAAEERRQGWLTEIKEQPEWRKQLPKLNFQERRFLNSFPNMKSKELKSPLMEIRELSKELRKK